MLLRRRLRIAWTVFFAVLTVALCVLWVRSYWWHNIFYFRVPFTDVFGADSRLGTIYMVSGETRVPMRWGIISEYLTAERIEKFYDDTDPIKPIFRNPSRLGIGFTQLRRSGWKVLSLPYWLAAVIFLLFAAAAWLPFRFSIRTMLIVTTLVAVVLGLAVWAMGRG